MNFNDSNEIDKRKTDLFEMYESGFTLEKIGQKYGITRERVRQIINKVVMYKISELNEQGIAIDIDTYRTQIVKKHNEGKGKRRPKNNKYLQKHSLKRWSVCYDRCRMCGTNRIHHHSRGYCKICYPKSEHFKKLVRDSRERNFEEII